MKLFISYCRYYGVALTIAMFVARWTCEQPITIVDNEGDHRISSPDFIKRK